MTRDIRGDDVFDSRDVLERIKELEDTLEGETGQPAIDAADELAILEAFQADAFELPDWEYGETFIRDSYFREYAEQLAEDIGAIDGEATWPNTYIDWDAAALALQQDYTAFELDGVTYWARD